jgi:16S rRNA (uracil1498-N3)-methyltransferase
VRRAREGDPLRLRDEEGTLYDARVAAVLSDSLEAEITAVHRGPAPSIEITLCMALLKGGNFDVALEKAVEVGVSRIVPVVTERTIPRPADETGRMRRWSRKAMEAAKQSLRERVPAVDPVSSFGEVIEAFHEGPRIIAHPGAAGSMREFLRSERAPRAVILVGPEGGFSPGELRAAEDAGWRALNFGFSHLRAETAAPLLCGIIIYEWGA